MYISFIVAVLSVLIAFLFRKTESKIPLRLSFIIVGVFVAIHYQFGNDYGTYLRRFYDYQLYTSNPFDIAGIIECWEATGHEIGWIALNTLFRPFGFFGFQIALTAFEFYALYMFFVKYINKNYYWLGIALLVFNANLFMIACMSMMRQWFACAVFLISIKYIIEKRPVSYIALILLAASFHISALVLLFVYFINLIPFEKFSLKSLVILVICLFAWYYIAPRYISERLDLVFGIDAFSDYEMYNNDDYHVGRFPYVSGLFIPICVWLITKYLNREQRIIIWVSLLSVVVIPLSYTSASLMGRVAYFFSIVSLIANPIIVEKANKVNVYLSLLIIFVLLYPLVTGFTTFFSNETWQEGFSSYHTIFSTQWQ